MELQGTLSSARLGWKSQPAITRLREALTEIKLVSRIDPILGAEGAVALLERISPALENVDSSSGAIGTAVNHTIAELVPVIVAAPADTSTRAAWLDRLFDAHGADQAMVAQGRHMEAIAFAESCRNPWASDQDIDGLCEKILLSTGRIDEAYARYALTANRTGTFLGWFRAVAKKYPNVPRTVVLADLVQLTPGDEGKWFAAAKNAGLLDGGSRWRIARRAIPRR